MPGIDCYLVQFRRHAVDAKGLVTQLARFDHLIAEAHIRLHRLRLRALKGQILRSHIAVFSVWCCDFIPTGRGLVQYNDLAALFVLSKDFVIRARAGA